jgi:hypothetical protein
VIVATTKQFTHSQSTEQNTEQLNRTVFAVVSHPSLPEGKLQHTTPIIYVYKLYIYPWGSWTTKLDEIKISAAKKHHDVLLYDVLLLRHAGNDGAKAAAADTDPLPVEGLEAAFVVASQDVRELSDKRRA